MTVRERPLDRRTFESKVRLTGAWRRRRRGPARTTTETPIAELEDADEVVENFGCGMLLCVVLASNLHVDCCWSLFFCFNLTQARVGRRRRAVRAHGQPRRRSASVARDVLIPAVGVGGARRSHSCAAIGSQNLFLDDVSGARRSARLETILDRA